MKRFYCLILCMAILFLTSACFGRSESSVSFYYCRNDFEYGAEDGVIVAEERSTSGHAEDLEYLLSLYLVGPLEEAFFSPLPSDVRLISADIQNNTVFITLSELPDTMTESGITLAFSCLTLTCLELTEAQQVTIISGDRSITMDRGSFLLFDNVTAISATEDIQ